SGRAFVHSTPPFPFVENVTSGWFGLTKVRSGPGPPTVRVTTVPSGRVNVLCVTRPFSALVMVTALFLPTNPVGNTSGNGEGTGVGGVAFACSAPSTQPAASAATAAADRKNRSEALIGRSFRVG